MCNISEFYIEQATERGLEQGLKQGIKALVSTLREFNCTNELILNKIIEKFNLTKEEALEYL